MKVLITTIIFTALTAAPVIADQRFETDQGQCHFAYDANDDDNEVYFANCINTINTYDANDGQGRLAYGTSVMHALTVTEGMSLPVRLQGNAGQQNSEYTTTNTNCQMVTSNYNGDGTNNYTTYNTNDWTLTIVGGKQPKYVLECRNAAAQ